MLDSLIAAASDRATLWCSPAKTLDACEGVLDAWAVRYIFVLGQTKVGKAEKCPITPDSD